MKTNRRPALTLMELLVVIAILAVLFGFLLGILLSSLQRGLDVKTATEIARMQNGLEDFKNDHGFYPPPQVRLCERYSDYTNSLLDERSKEILGQMFNGIDHKNGAWKMGFIDWDGDGAPSPPITLTGDQCLVFFLGGIPNQLAPATRGFGPDTNPALRQGKVYFKFEKERLTRTVRGNNFYSYLDPFTKQPYAYFSATKWGYNAWTTFGGFPTDCPGLGGVNVSPYLSAPGTFHNPTTFQIISAGRDGVFGPGGAVLITNTGTTLPGAAQDDRTNFSARVLGGF